MAADDLNHQCNKVCNPSIWGIVDVPRHFVERCIVGRTAQS